MDNNNMIHEIDGRFYKVIEANEPECMNCDFYTFGQCTLPFSCVEYLKFHNHYEYGYFLETEDL